MDANEWLPPGYEAPQVAGGDEAGSVALEDTSAWLPSGPAKRATQSPTKPRPARKRRVERRPGTPRDRNRRVERKSVERDERPAPEPVSSLLAPAEGGLDLNSASFEQLRELKLSVTQSARVIAQRDQRGGFRSLEDLDSLYGLPREAIATLRRAAGARS